MSGVSGTGRNEIYRYYQYMSSKKRRCNKKIIKKDFIEDIVISAAISIFSGIKRTVPFVTPAFLSRIRKVQSFLL